MKKLYTIISIMLLTMFAAVAQAPERFSYQAVVRNANNSLVANANVGVRVSILQGGATGNSVYTETHTAGTNANGLLTVEIGGGNAQQGSFQSIDWGSGNYFLKTEVDPNGGSNYSITSVQQLMSVPYALYAKTASNGFSGNIADYLTPATIPSFLVALQQAGVAMQSDIPEIPEIPTVPTNVSAFTNDAGYITAAQLPVIPENQVLSISNDTIFLTNGGFVKLPAATVGFSGDYNDLTNKPVIPTVPTNVSAFTNDAGYITGAAVPTFAVTQTDTGYVLTMTPPNGAPQHYVLRDGNDGAAGLPGLPGTPGFSPTITVSQGATGTVLTITDVNGTNQYVIPSSGGASGTLVQLPANWNETDPTSPQFILNKPELFSGNYEDLQNKPELFSGDYNDLQNKPTIPTVPTNVSAFTNDAGYITEADLPAMPVVPTDVSAFNNDAGYITAEDIPAATEQVNADWNATEGAAEILNKPELAPVATSGDYNDLTNKPNVPTKLSQLTNDVGFISQLPDSMGGGISTETDPLFSAWDKDYNDLINKPEIPTVPENVSAFTNDAGYITESDLPAMPAVPTDVSAFNNDAGYITEADLPEIPTVPTNVSAFNNDAGYITAADIPAATEQVNADWNATEGAAQILNKPELFSGDYNDLTNKPVIPSVPTNVSAFTNDAGYITEADLPAIPTVPTDVSAFNNDAGFITAADIPAATEQVNADWNATEGAAEILNKPSIPTKLSQLTNDVGFISQLPDSIGGGISTETDPLFSAWDKDYNDLTNKPVLFSGNYEDLQNKPELFSGDYNDLTNKPAIPSVPTNVSAFTNDAGYITEADLPEIPTVPTDVSAFNNDAGYITESDLPAMPAVPTKVSELENDANYITADDIPAATEQVKSDWNATTGAAEILNKPNLAPVATSGNYNDLSNKPVIPSVPTNVSEFTNDAGYAYEADFADVAYTGNYNDLTNKPNFDNFVDFNDLNNALDDNLANVAFTGNYNDLTNKPTIPTVPTDVSAFNNDAGYITAADIPAATEQVKSDWNATSGAAQILNKPNLATVATTGNYNDLTNKPDLANVVHVWDLVEMEEYLTGVINQKCNKLQNKIDSLANIIGQRPLVVINTIFYGDRNSTLVKTRITNDFGEPILYEGVCYGTSPNPTITNSAVVTQPLFVSNDGYNYKSYYINNLTAGQTYYIRAFATSPHGTTYYGSSTFVPSYYAVPPTGSKSVTFPSGQNTMEVYDYGGPFNYDNNFNGSLTINPGVAGKRVKINAIELTSEQNYDSLLIYVGGVLQYELHGTYNNSNFNVMGSGADKSVTLKFISDYTNVKSGFKVTLSLVDDPYPCAGISNVKDVENNTYGIVAIGNQCWMKENLRTKKFADGTSITLHSPGTSVSNEDRRNNAFCCYVSNASSASTYGLLYNWRAVMKNNESGSASNPSGLQGICPTGWHVPSFAELEQMINNVKSVSTNRCNNNSNFIAKSLAATNLWTNSTVSCSPGKELQTNNATGFSAVPAGRWSDGVYSPSNNDPAYSGNSTAYFWTSTLAFSTGQQFKVVFVTSDEPKVNTAYYSQTRDAYSVRCVRN